jgi:Flp pilus assembly protein TadG
MRYLKKVLRDEKGATMIMVAVAIVIIFGFAVLAIDLSLVQLAKTQLQNAADAGSLAGAMALALSTGDEATATAEAEAEAIRVAGLNVAVQDIQRPVVIDGGDVDVLYDSGKVTVTTHRTKAKGDPVTLYFLKVLDPLVENKGEMTATASARVMPISGTSCLRPFCPPDRWDDADGDSAWDPGEFYDPYITGYMAPRDVGVQVRLKLRNSNKWPLEEWYYAVDFPPLNDGDPITGADQYREWIIGCADPTIEVNLGDKLQLEPGNMKGPTNQGLDALIALDPNAQWDPATNTVINSAYALSPRIIKAAAFDPTVGVEDDEAGRKYVTVTKLMALFIDRHDSDEVVGWFMNLVTEGEPCPGCPQGFLTTVRLVE